MFGVWGVWDLRGVELVWGIRKDISDAVDYNIS
jgi:hypothetical protein